MAEENSRIDAVLDVTFFVLGGVAAVWLAYQLFRASFNLGWIQLVFLIVFWVLLAYLVLPRLHRILTRVYVPNYFLGRTRTSDGLLGDPINLALLGSEAQVHEAMTRAGWTLADDLSFSTGMKIVRSTVRRQSYLEAPVSPLELFERQQDFAYQQEVDGTPGKRHHVRFWKCPPGWLLPGGYRADWLAAGTYDRSVGFSLFTLQVTHKIDADTDVERDHVVATVSAAEPAASVTTIRDFSTGYHARNGGGDAIVTDGDLPVIDLRGLAEGEAGAVAVIRPLRRPAPTTVGAILLVLRAGAASLVAAVVGLNWVGGLTTPGVAIDPGSSSALVWGVVGVVGVFALLELFLAWRVFAGRNWARLIGMVLSLLAIITQAVTGATGGASISWETNLLGLSIDVLILLALSSERSREYAYARRRN